MTSRWIGIPSRIALLACGLVSLALSRVYLALRGLDSSFHESWWLFSTTLMTLGGLAVFIALLPGSWAEKAFKIEPGKLSSVPLRLLAGFALVSYLLVVGLSFAHNSSLSPRLAFFLLGLAPMSAAVYGSLGGILGYVYALATILGKR